MEAEAGKEHRQRNVYYYYIIYYYIMYLPEPLFALSHIHRTAQHPPAARYPFLPIGATGAHLTARHRPYPNAQTTQPGMDSSLVLSAGSPE
jgi:hypothetical protein